jgi:hypothetical protein
MRDLARLPMLKQQKGEMEGPRPIEALSLSPTG